MKLPKWLPYAAVLLLLPAALLFFSAGKLHYPTAQWDGWALDSVQAIRAGTFAADPYIIHPPLYLYLLAFFRPLLGADLLAGARLFNFGCYLITGWLVFLLSRRLAGKELGAAAGLAGALLYFLSPLAFQGIFLLDLGDTGPVPVAAAAYFFLLFYGGGFLRFAALSAAFALNIWAKLIHSLFLAAAVLVSVFTGEKDDHARADIAALAVGIILFVSTWAIYAYTSLQPADQWGPLKYFVNTMLVNYQHQDLMAGPREIFIARVLAVARVMLWLWPVLFLWAWRIIKRGLGSGPEKLMNCFILIFMIGAWVSKGTSNGFPKYHAALLPAICALCGAYAAEFLADWRRTERLRLAVMAAAAILCVYMAGDPLYTFNYSLKAALISDSGLYAAIIKLGLQILVIPALLIGFFIVFRKFREKTSAAAISLAVSALVWQAGIFGRQAGGDYFTHYGYGTSGKARTINYVRDNFRGGTVFGPNEFVWDLKAAGVPSLDLSDRCFIDKKCALSAIRDKDTAFFIFGQASNTVEQVKSFLALTPEKLGRPFTAVKKGDFWIYDFVSR